MSRSGKPAYFVSGALLCALLFVAEFVFPNYVSRIAGQLVDDTGSLIRGEYFGRDHGMGDDTVLSNEFVFQFVALQDAPTRRSAGVLGPDGDGHFLVVDQYATDIAGHDITPLLQAMGAWYPDNLAGGIKQLIEVDSALFGLFALTRDGCTFAALVDLERLELVDEFPCILDVHGPFALDGLGGGYEIVEDTSLMLALGTGNGFTWTASNANAQDPASPYGKTLQYDIAMEADGPRLVNRRIVTSGHRNSQGMVRFGALVMAVEHGPMGGDEINVIEEGSNYGWPLYSAGSQYNMGDLTSFAPEGAGVEDPLFTFVPSIGISDITTCPSIIAARYETADCVIVSGLVSRAIFIVLGDFANRRVRSVEQIDVGLRVREVFVHDDILYLLPDDAALIRADIEARPCDATAGPCGHED